MNAGTTAQPAGQKTAGARRPALPSLAEIAMLGTGLRRTAQPEWEDENGHVNVCRHYAFHMDTSIEFFARFGVGHDYLARHGQSTFSIEQHLTFYDEVLVGHVLSGHVRLLGVNSRLLHGVSVMVNHTTGRLANTVEFVEGHVDLATRRTTPWQPALAAALQAERERHVQLPWTLPLSGSMGLR